MTKPQSEPPGALAASVEPCVSVLGDSWPWIFSHLCLCHWFVLVAVSLGGCAGGFQLSQQAFC